MAAMPSRGVRPSTWRRPRPGPAPIAGIAMCPTRGSRQAARVAAAAPASRPRSPGGGGGAEVAPRPGEVSEALQPALPHPPPAPVAGSGSPTAAPADVQHGKVSPLHAPGPPCRAPWAAGAALGGDRRGGIVAGETGAILGRSAAWRPRAGPPRCEGSRGPRWHRTDLPSRAARAGLAPHAVGRVGPPWAPGVNSKSGAGGAARPPSRRPRFCHAGLAQTRARSPRRVPAVTRRRGRDAGRSGWSGSCSAALGTRLLPRPGTTAARRRELLGGLAPPILPFPRRSLCLLMAHRPALAAEVCV